MSLGTANRDGGKTSESGHLRGLTKAFRGEVSNGLAVSQRGAGANMSVDIAIGDAIIPRSDGTYGHPAFNDAVLNQAIATADPSNPRRDIVVMYIDYTQTPSTGVSNNTNGVVKVKVVAGTPAGSPVDPTDTAIQSSVGAGNPFIKLARARVGAGVTSVGNSVIDDLRRMATAHIQGGWLYEYQYVWQYVSASSFKIAGVDARVAFPVGTKILLYQGSVVKYFVVTSTSFSTDTTVNVNGYGTYTLANDIIDHPAYSYMLIPQGWPFPANDPAGQTLGYAETLTTASTTSIPAVLIPGATVTVTIPLGVTHVTIYGFNSTLYCSTNGVAAHLSIWQGTVGSGTQLQDSRGFQGGSSGTGSPTPFRRIAVTPGNTYTFSLGLASESGATVNAEASTTKTTAILVQAS